MKLGLCSTVFIVLLILKLCEVAVIPWLWVFMPLIVMVTWWFVVVLFIFIVFIAKIYEEFKK